MPPAVSFAEDRFFGIVCSTRCFTTVRKSVIRQMFAMPSCMTTATRASSLSSLSASSSVSLATLSHPGLPYRECAVELEIEGVVLPNVHECVLAGDRA